MTKSEVLQMVLNINMEKVAYRGLRVWLKQ
jgi:hypothetical protein